jgi:HSP20 family protein
MNPIKIVFDDDFGEMETEFYKTFDSIFRLMNPALHGHQSWKPQMDAYESSEEIVIVAEIAGINKEDLHIEVSRRSVKIHGKRKRTTLMEDIRYSLVEIPYGRFERVLMLPAPINTETVSAKYTDGLLQIRITKLPPNQAYKVPIQKD